VIRDLPTTRRYLTQNVYQPTKLQEKESIPDATYDKIRQISFKNSKMKEKADETEVIDIFIDKERAKLEVGRNRYLEYKK